MAEAKTSTFLALLAKEHVAVCALADLADPEIPACLAHLHALLTASEAV